MIEVLKQMVTALEDTSASKHISRNSAIQAGLKAIAELESQEPVAWMKPDVLCDRACMYLCTKGFTQFPECATIHPPQRKCENCGEFGTCCLKTESQERNFCPRCGKRTKHIHTCTPPRENT